MAKPIIFNWRPNWIINHFINTQCDGGWIVTMSRFTKKGLLRMIWIPIWKIVLIIGLCLFLIISILVIIGGILELKQK